MKQPKIIIGMKVKILMIIYILEIVNFFLYMLILLLGLLVQIKIHSLLLKELNEAGNKILGYIQKEHLHKNLCLMFILKLHIKINNYIYIQKRHLQF